MDLIKAEIARKKREMAESKVMAGPDRKYFKRADLSEKQRQDYHRSQLEKEKKRQQEADDAEAEKKKKAEDRKKDEDAAGSSCSAPSAAAPPPEPAVKLSRAEVVRRLRDRLQPVLLFGETEDEAGIRLREIELDEPDEEGGRRNDFRKAMDEVDKVYLQDMLEQQQQSGGGDGDGNPDDEDASASSSSTSQAIRSKFDVQLYDSELSYDDLLDMVNDINKGDIAHDHKLITEFIKVMLRKWGEELNARDDDVKMNVRGKIDAGTYTQTRTYVKPLLRMLRKQTVTDDIRDSLLKMVRYALQRDYILCNECYMEMAIGNAPWPIGVTNAGIHARPARENIFSKHVAHVLNDETQRKFIQGLKRLLTKAQQYYPTDPSRSIDYTRKQD